MVGWFVLAIALVFAINMVPALMPATWMVLSFFYIQFDLPLLPLAAFGALTSGLGRAVLAIGSTRIVELLPSSRQSHLLELGMLLNDHRNLLAILCSSTR
ncbi:MAG: hypothetical protein WEB00_04150 [Dehalococcoidia bacterium]